MPFGDLVIPLEPYIEIGYVIPRELAPNGAWYMTERREKERMGNQRVNKKE